MGLKQRVERLKTDIPAVFLALRDKRTPLAAKIIGAVAVGYALSPLDLIPDFIPVLGYLDDVLILPVLLAATIKLIPPDVLAEHRERAKGLWPDGKPRRWYYAVPVVVVWLLLAYLLIKAIWF